MTLDLPADLPATGAGGRVALERLAGAALGQVSRLDHPGFLAHMDPPTPWMTWAASAWAAATNQNLLHPDASWRQRGERERRLLNVTLAPWLVAPVEHVGSTAVPGLAAKPILDLQAAVADLGCAPDLAVALGPASWHHVPADLDGRPWRRFFVKVLDGHRAAHLHVMRPDSARWSEQLALRADPALVKRYAALKRRLADRHSDDREAYTEANETFVRAVLANGKGGPWAYVVPEGDRVAGQCPRSRPDDR